MKDGLNAENQGFNRVSSVLNRNHAMGGPPPSRRLTAWESPRGQIVRELLVPYSVRILGCGKSARPPRLDGVSRRDGGGPCASLRLNRKPVNAIFPKSRCAVAAFRVPARVSALTEERAATLFEERFAAHSAGVGTGFVKNRPRGESRSRRWFCARNRDGRCTRGRMPADRLGGFV